LARAAHVVAHGTVVQARPADARFGLRSGGEVDLFVDRALKGATTGTLITFAIAPDGPGSVGYWTAEVGTRHTVYLRPRSEWPPWPGHATATLYTTLCFGSHEGPPTAEELAVFGPVGDGALGALGPLATVLLITAGAAGLVWRGTRNVRYGLAAGLFVLALAAAALGVIATVGFIAALTLALAGGALYMSGKTAT
jgi:hypothetical protein